MWRCSNRCVIIIGPRAKEGNKKKLQLLLIVFIMLQKCWQFQNWNDIPAAARRKKLICITQTFRLADSKNLDVHRLLEEFLKVKIGEVSTSPGAQVPKSPGAQEPRFQEPNSSGAQVPKSPEAQEPRSPRAQEPKSPEAQEPRSPRAQKPKSPEAQKPKYPNAQEPKYRKATL
jgi:hypothetical protein